MFLMLSAFYNYMYTIKQIPEDFIVKELSSVKALDKGDYGLFRLRKRDCTTLKACKWIAESLKIPLKYVGFAGIKDRHAVTEQMVSIKGKGKAAERVSNKIMQISFLGWSDSPVSLGDLSKNGFEITVRNIDKGPERITQIINYFDDQRFSKNNHLVGKAVIKRDFKGACDLLDEPSVKGHLSESPSDYIGAIKSLPLKARLIYIHAYQSWLFNRMIVEFLKDIDCLKASYSLGELLFPKEKIDDMKIPLIGFGTQPCGDSPMDKIMTDILSEEKIKARDFIIKGIPEMSAEGNLRDITTEVKDLAVGPLEDDELNPGKKKVTVSFSLKKGSYATIAIKRMFL
jgi:tRNA pseudouridine13 synthase